MSALAPMPPVEVAQADLILFGNTWTTNGGSLSRTPPQSSGEFGKLFDTAVGIALAKMLGNIPVVAPKINSLTPSQADCVEVGPVRIIGGIRPQNFDVGYRPDGVRFAFDSKSLNDKKSVGKNWQNMINDLATEATTVHSRFPHALVAFMVIIPEPCFASSLRAPIVQTLERLGRRSPEDVNGPPYMAEAISLVIWHPSTGTVSSNIPDQSSLLRIEKFSNQVEAAYSARYKGLPPHAAE